MSGKIKITALLAAVLLSLPLMADVRPADTALAQTVASKLQDKKQFHNVNVSADDQVLTLSGSVNKLQDKIDVEKRARKAAKGAEVRDQVQVASTVPDDVLRAKLAKSLAYDRADFGNVFNVIELGVQDGVATLKGEVRSDVDKSSALAVVNNTAGVKAVVDQLRIAPVSMFDDDIRVRAMQAIYRDPVLSKYAMDPQAPIRILVDNGRIGLYGTVDSPMDKQVAMMRASSVFGAFQVENHLATPAEQTR